MADADTEAKRAGKRTVDGSVKPSDIALKKLSRELAKFKARPDNSKDPDWFVAEPVDESNILLWNAELFNFNGDIGDALKSRNLNSIKLGLRFPIDYPMKPPFVWLIYPHITGGHVQGGGGICMEQLMESGWTPATSIESLVHSVRSTISMGRVNPSEHANQKEKPHTELSASRDFAFIKRAHTAWERQEPRAPRKPPAF